MCACLRINIFSVTRRMRVSCQARSVYRASREFVRGTKRAKSSKKESRESRESSILVASQPGTTPLAACPTYQVRSSTSAKTVHGDPSCTAPGVCMWPKTVDQTGLQGSRGRGSAPRPRGPPAARPRCAHALCCPHTGPGPAPPAPARASRPHRPPAPARTRPRRPGAPSTRPRTPAPARRRKAPMALRHRSH